MPSWRLQIVVSISARQAPGAAAHPRLRRLAGRQLGDEKEEKERQSSVIIIAMTSVTSLPVTHCDNCHCICSHLRVTFRATIGCHHSSIIMTLSLITSRGHSDSDTLS